MVDFPEADGKTCVEAPCPRNNFASLGRVVFHSICAEVGVGLTTPRERDKLALVFVEETAVGVVAGALGVLAVEGVGVLNMVPFAPITAPLGVVHV